METTNRIAEISSNASTLATKVTYGGGFLAVVGGMTATEVAAYGGLLIGFFGFIVNTYFKWVENKRAQELHGAKMAEWDGQERRNNRCNTEE